MLKSILILIFLCGGSAGYAQEKFAPPAMTLSQAEAVLTLTDCYELALKQSEPLQILSEKIHQSEEKYKQAKGSVLPRLSFNFSEFFQDTSGTGDGGSGVSGTFTRGERPESKFIIRQPIFSGFREFAAMASLKSEKQKEKFVWNRAAKILFQDVARAFYRIIQFETELENLKTLLELTQDRVRELQTRVKLGKSRPSEILSVESQFSSLKSQEEQLKEEIASTREILSLFIGKDADSARLTDTMGKLEEIEPEEESLKRAGFRSDLKALQEDVESKRHRLKIVKGGLMPSANLLGNYYTKRVGFQESINWDILLSLDIPLFQGGAGKAQVRESLSELREAEFSLIRLQREIRTEIKKAYLALRSSLTQSKTLEQAYKKAEESYTLQVQEYRLGLVNNLEILQAMNTMQEAKRKFESTAIQIKLNFLQLKVATEELP